MSVDPTNLRNDWYIALSFLVAILFFVFGYEDLGHLATGVMFVIIGFILVFTQEKELKVRRADPSDVSYAGFWVRCGSLIADWGFISLWCLTLYAIWGSTFYDYFKYSFALISWLILEIYMYRFWGQTPGKMLVGIVVVRSDLQKLTWKEVLLRESLTILNDAGYLLKAILVYFMVITPGMIFTNPSMFSALPSDFFGKIFDKMSLVWWIWILSETVILLINYKKRALHDYLAGTVVTIQKRVKFRSWILVFILGVFALGDYWYFFIDNDFMVKFLAEKGEPKWEFGLGSNYQMGGCGEPKDYGLALKWYQKAADQGFPAAQFSLGMMYEVGQGVTADPQKAIQLYTLAAQKDFYPAKMFLKQLNDEKLIESKHKALH